MAISEAVGIVKNLRSGDYVRNADVESSGVNILRFEAISLQILNSDLFGFLCGPLRISAISALRVNFNAEDAEIRRGPQRKAN